MPRKLRVEYSGAIHPGMSCEDRQKDIFLNEVGGQDFRNALAEPCRKTGFQAHACRLMRNHFHRVVETPGAKRHQWMKANAEMATRPKTKTK